MKIEIEIEDDNTTVIGMMVDYSIEEDESDVGFVGGVRVERIHSAWINVCANWVEDGERIVDIPLDSLNAEVEEKIEDEIKRILSRR